MLPPPLPEDRGIPPPFPRGISPPLRRAGTLSPEPSSRRPLRLLMGAGIALAIIVVVCVVVAIAIPRQLGVADNSGHEQSAENLRLFLEAGVAFAAENGDRLPDRIEQLRGAFPDDFERRLDLPFTTMRESSGYELAPGVTRGMPADTIVVWEKIPRRDGTHGVALLGGTIETRPTDAPEMQRLLTLLWRGADFPDMDGTPPIPVENLKTIWRACLLHADRNRGRFPDYASQLRPILGGEFDQVMDLPFTPEVETNGYVLINGLNNKMSRTTPVAFEARPRDDGSRAVIYLDGRIVVWQRNDRELQRVLRW